MPISHFSTLGGTSPPYQAESLDILKRNYRDHHIRCTLSCPQHSPANRKNVTAARRRVSHATTAGSRRWAGRRVDVHHVTLVYPPPYFQPVNSYSAPISSQRGNTDRDSLNGYRFEGTTMEPDVLEVGARSRLLAMPAHFARIETSCRRAESDRRLRPDMNDWGPGSGSPVGPPVGRCRWARRVPWPAERPGPAMPSLVSAAPGRSRPAASACFPA